MYTTDSNAFEILYSGSVLALIGLAPKFPGCGSDSVGTFAMVEASDSTFTDTEHVPGWAAIVGTEYRMCKYDAFKKKLNE